MLALSVSCFLKVFLAGLQTKNVQHSKYVSIALTSLVMSVADAYMIKALAESSGPVAFIVVALSNSLGILLAVYLHDRARERKSL